MYIPITLVALLSSFALATVISGHITTRQATNGPDPGTIIWVCTAHADPAQDIPEVCINMCYGAYCRGYGTSLTWDEYAGRSREERREAAGCGKHNHCMTDPPATGSYMCNTYPFGSTSESDRTDMSAVNRCVPSGQSNLQRARLYQLFNSKGPWENSQGLNGSPPAGFHQTFANSGELAYCNGKVDDGDCLSDGLEFDKSGRIPDTICNGTVPRRHIKYRLRSGGSITVPDEFDIGHRVWLPREHNSTLLVEQSESHIYDQARGPEQFEHMAENLYMEEDFVEQRVS